MDEDLVVFKKEPVTWKGLRQDWHHFKAARIAYEMQEEGFETLVYEDRVRIGLAIAFLNAATAPDGAVYRTDRNLKYCAIGTRSAEYNRRIENAIEALASQLNPR